MKAKYIYQIGAFLLGSLIFSGCVDWEEYESLDLASAPTVTVVQSNVGDSVIVVNVTSSADGFVAAILLEGTGNPLPSDSSALLKGNVNYLAYAYGEAEANGATALTFASDVQQNTTYEVMAVAANADGVVSDIEVIEITTTDNYPPSLVSAAPGFTYDPVLELGSSIELVFDEAVVLGDGKFTFESFRLGDLVDVPTDSITVTGNSVIIALPFDPVYGDYLWLHWEEGAVEDLAGNGVPALTTIYDAEDEAGPFVGAFWRVEQVELDPVSISPDVEVAQDFGFDIVLTFDRGASFPTTRDADNNVVIITKDGDLTLTYDDGDGIVIVVDVKVADIVIDGAEITIPQVEMIPFGGTVTLDVPSGAFLLGYGNPNAEISVTWEVNEIAPV